MKNIYAIIIATAVFSNISALVWEEDPSLTPEERQERIELNARIRRNSQKENTNEYEGQDDVSVDTDNSPEGTQDSFEHESMTKKEEIEADGQRQVISNEESNQDTLQKAEHDITIDQPRKFKKYLRPIVLEQPDKQESEPSFENED